MAFTGADYHAAFEDACDKLRYLSDREEVRAQLEVVEWILWEAIRGVFVYASVIVAGILVFFPFYLIVTDKTAAAVLLAVAIMFVVTVALYWLFRLLFRIEISSHVRGRRFGGG